jgi:hypothetical protein
LFSIKNVSDSNKTLHFHFYNVEYLSFFGKKLDIELDSILMNNKSLIIEESFKDSIENNVSFTICNKVDTSSEIFYLRRYIIPTIIEPASSNTLYISVSGRKRDIKRIKIINFKMEVNGMYEERRIKI